MKKMVLASLVVFMLAGCITGTGGVVQIGENQYMVGGHGSGLDYSGSAVKAKFYQEANMFCAEKGLVSQQINSSAKDAGVGTYASAEVQFRCVKPKNP